MARVGSGTAATLLAATIAWQLYDISGSALQLGLVGLVRFAPSLGLSLVGGAVADAFDRKRVAIAAQVASLLCGAALLAGSADGEPGYALIYGMAFLVSVASAFDNPARQAMLPQVVTRESFANAIAVSTTVQQLGFVTGPALAGGLIAASGPALSYLAFCVLMGVAVVAMLLLRLRPMEGERRTVSLAAVKEGVQFVRSRQVLLGAMTLDMFAVIFGGAQALLPVYAEDILHVGPVGYGLLYGSLDLGAFLMSIALVWRPPVVRAGLVLLCAVAAFGLGTIVFGLSRWFPLSLGAYMFIGMSDQVSVVMRQTTIQLATPDALRGRVTSVNMLFIGASNQLGAMESGFVAALTTATFAVVSGGIGCLAVVAAVALGMPELRRHRIGRARGSSLVESRGREEEAEEEAVSTAAGG